MRQMLMLEREDLQALKEGHPLTLNVNGQHIVLVVEKRRAVSPAPPADGAPVLRRQHTDTFKSKVVLAAAAAKKGGESIRDVARKFGINDSLIYHWMKVAKKKAAS